MDHPDGPRQDANPHTADLSPYALASMLTFSQDGSPVEVVDPISRIAHMTYAGKPDRARARRDWAVWELKRMGAEAEARRLAELVDSRGGAVVPAA
jgi:hypothetical protein